MSGRGGGRGGPRGGGGRGRGHSRGRGSRSTPKATHRTPAASAKQQQRQRRLEREAAAADALAAEAQLGPVSFGFVRGTNPDRWNTKWQQRHPGRPLTFEALGEDPLHSDPGQAVLDAGGVLLVRAPAVAAPRSDRSGKALHAVKLYDEKIGLIVARDSDFVKLTELDDLGLLDLEMLLDHPGHLPGWPEPTPWADPSYAPRSVAEACELVATGLGSALAALPLAQHVTDRKLHRVIPLAEMLTRRDGSGDTALPKTAVFAVWHTAHDSNTVQELVGMLRGRTAHSSR